jgi:hypothetical protein
MRWSLLLLFCLIGHCTSGQNVQLVYDMRHTTDPGNNPKNFPTLYFEYFNQQDSGKSLIKPGSFLFKFQADGLAPGTNTGKVYFQLAQTLRFWRPKVFLHFSFSSGLGVTEPKQYSYYILNTYAAGAAWPFQWNRGFYSLVLDYKYVPYAKPTSDLLWTFYFYGGFFKYRCEWLGDFSFWTENKNHGDSGTQNLSGKRFFFYAEPQFWYRVAGGFSLGARLNLYYHVYTSENKWQGYPALGIRWKI